MDAMNHRGAGGARGNEEIGNPISQYPRILNSHDRNPGMGPVDASAKMGMAEKLSGSNNYRKPQKRKRIACKECRQAKVSIPTLRLATKTDCSVVALF
jgi:hypothetical protein